MQPLLDRRLPQEVGYPSIVCIRIRKVDGHRINVSVQKRTRLIERACRYIYGYVKIWDIERLSDHFVCPYPEL
jgi:hypothetical protein